MLNLQCDLCMSDKIHVPSHAKYILDPGHEYGYM